MPVIIVSKSYIFRDALFTCCTQRNISVRSNCNEIGDIIQVEQDDIVLLHTGCTPSEIREELIQLKAMEPRLRVILLTEKSCTNELRQHFSGQVHAIIPDDRSVDILISALTVVQEGYSLLRSAPGLLGPLAKSNLIKSAEMMNGHIKPDNTTSCALDKSKKKTLSPRENVILAHLTSGDSNKDIANDLGISETTVKVQLRTCYQKIGVKNRTQAAIWAVMHL